MTPGKPKVTNGGFKSNIGQQPQEEEEDHSKGNGQLLVVGRDNNHNNHNDNRCTAMEKATSSSYNQGSVTYLRSAVKFQSIQESYQEEEINISQLSLSGGANQMGDELEYILYYTIGPLFVRPVAIFHGRIVEEFHQTIPYLLRRSNGEITWLQYSPRNNAMVADRDYLLNSSISPRNKNRLSSIFVAPEPLATVFVYGEMNHGFSFQSPSTMDLKGNLFIGEIGDDGLNEERKNVDCIIQVTNGNFVIFISDQKDIIVLPDNDCDWCMKVADTASDSSDASHPDGQDPDAGRPVNDSLLRLMKTCKSKFTVKMEAPKCSTELRVRQKFSHEKSVNAAGTTTTLAAREPPPPPTSEQQRLVASTAAAATAAVVVVEKENFELPPPIPPKSADTAVLINNKINKSQQVATVAESESEMLLIKSQVLCVYDETLNEMRKISQEALKQIDMKILATQNRKQEMGPAAADTLTKSVPVTKSSSKKSRPKTSSKSRRSKLALKKKSKKTKNENQVQTKESFFKVENKEKMLKTISELVRKMENEMPKSEKQQQQPQPQPQQQPEESTIPIATITIFSKKKASKKELVKSQGSSKVKILKTHKTQPEVGRSEKSKPGGKRSKQQQQDGGGGGSSCISKKKSQKSDKPVRKDKSSSKRSSRGGGGGGKKSSPQKFRAPRRDNMVRKSLSKFSAALAPSPSCRAMSSSVRFSNSSVGLRKLSSHGSRSMSVLGADDQRLGTVNKEDSIQAILNSARKPSSLNSVKARYENRLASLRKDIEHSKKSVCSTEDKTVREKKFTSLRNAIDAAVQHGRHFVTTVARFRSMEKNQQMRMDFNLHRMKELGDNLDSDSLNPILQCITNIEEVLKTINPKNSDDPFR